MSPIRIYCETHAGTTAGGFTVNLYFLFVTRKRISGCSMLPPTSHPSAEDSSATVMPISAMFHL